MGVAKNLALIFIELHNMFSIWAVVFPHQFYHYLSQTLCPYAAMLDSRCLVMAP